jgi:hypothetical protein
MNGFQGPVTPPTDPELAAKYSAPRSFYTAPEAR